ncbi:Rhotekin [Trichuris trichiura]|uniref:Rhotekin n=1 Tax=Trichuris trichiura TaxID=36087 RepID=A0A077ZI27_TRITR|nr:Rhotekin [Trichuris trichiura]
MWLHFFTIDCCFDDFYTLEYVEVTKCFPRSNLDKLRGRFIRGKTESASCRPSVRSSCRNNSVSVRENIKVESRLKSAAEKILQQWWLYPDNALSEASKSSIISKRRLECYESSQPVGLTRNVIEDDLPSMEIKRCYSICLPSKCHPFFCLLVIRIPLVCRGGESFHGKQGFDMFSVFALFELNQDVCDTQLKTVVYGLDTDVQFDEVLRFQNVPADFSMRLIIYSRALPSRDCQNRVSKGRRRMEYARRKLSFTQDTSSTYDILGYNDFEKIAVFRFDVDQVDRRGFVILDLNENAYNHNLPPNFGHVTFHLRLCFDHLKKVVSDESLGYLKGGQVHMPIRCILGVSAVEVIMERSGNDELLAWIPLALETCVANATDLLEICSPDGLSKHYFTGSPTALNRLREAIQLQQCTARMNDDYGLVFIVVYL